ncbi:MAG: LCP family protein [Clostridia bacterium]
MDKINHAYAFGGAEMSINTVQKFLGIPIDAYAVVNFAGFQKIVDAVGGSPSRIHWTFSIDGYSFTKGTTEAGRGQSFGVL